MKYVTLFLVFVSSPLLVNAVVHRINTVHLPRLKGQVERHGSQTKLGHRALPLPRQSHPTHRGDHSSDYYYDDPKEEKSAETRNQTAVLEGDLIDVRVIGDISIGSPPQLIQVWLTRDCDQLYVIGEGANYTLWGVVMDDVDDRSTFDTSDSDSFTSNSATNFTAWNYFQDGLVGSDVLGLTTPDYESLNYSAIMITTDVNYLMSWTDDSFEGAFGISTTRLSGNNTPTLLERLAPQLDHPVITEYFKFVYDERTKHYGGTGWVALGDHAPDSCEDKWIKLGTEIGIYSDYPIIRAGAISAGDGEVAAACSRIFTADFTLELIPYAFSSIEVSYQVEEIFAQASQAVWNVTVEHYVVPPELMATAQPVTFHLVDGAKLAMRPKEYIKEKDGIFYLGVYGTYNQRDTRQRWPAPGELTIGPLFMNHRCFSSNIYTGEWFMAEAKGEAAK